ncbi:TIR domain-containing protein [Methylomagnum ishizawai]|uniref:TIR domain-containing protein n=1 Tax=Methylomagnum ishizawai TaxID=1760988 RepID=A0A1Y6CSV9_9GAMM|nr:toll/interleukin-1 receptor domain-containing protein [Methylomagnum ishizawai]SMF93387.1 TIR domain-containing protein [Methylomagnum ishizawai]
MSAPTAQIFVSYAHADNQLFDAGTKGWITEFVDKLEKAIGMKPGGNNAKCWIDYRLEPQRKVDEALLGHIRESRFILAFMSPRYLESEWCAKEMHAFVELAGGHADDRVFLVELLPTKRECWHPGVQAIAELKFWTSSLDQPDPMILGWPVPDPKGDRPYWNELNRLATIIARQIQDLPPIPPDPPPPPDCPEPPTPPSGPLRVVINADQTDHQLGKAAQKLLDDLEVDSAIAPEPISTQIPEDYNRHLREQLEASHGVLIVYGLAPPSWVQSQHAMARKLLATQRKGIWSGLLDGPPQEKPDHGLSSRSLMVLDCRQGLSVEPLKNFVDALREHHV